MQEPTEQVGDVSKKYKGKSDLGEVHVWRENMSECIKAVLKEYDEEAHKQIQYMPEYGFIRHLDSLYDAPMVFIPKKDASL